MYQQIFVLGNLGTDAEMSYTPSGVPVTHFNVAANRRWTNADGELVEKTTWFRITAWRRLAETCAEFLAKGRQVLVVGEVEQARGWIDAEGTPRASIDVTASTVRFLGGRPLAGSAEGTEAAEEETEETPAAPPAAAKETPRANGNGNGKTAAKKLTNGPSRKHSKQAQPAEEELLDEQIPF